MRTSILALLISFSTLARAEPDCWNELGTVTESENMGSAHHPVNRPLPEKREYNQPDGCREGVWLFDRNGNGLADAAEVRLYGPNRAIACASCHGESPDAKSAASASVFLRQDAATLCLVCHNL